MEIDPTNIDDVIRAELRQRYTENKSTRGLKIEWGQILWDYLIIYLKGNAFPIEGRINPDRLDFMGITHYRNPEIAPDSYRIKP